MALMLKVIPFVWAACALILLIIMAYLNRLARMEIKHARECRADAKELLQKAEQELKRCLAWEKELERERRTT